MNLHTKKFLDDLTSDWLMRLPESSYGKKDINAVSSLKESLESIIGKDKDSKIFINEFIKNFVDAKYTPTPLGEPDPKMELEEGSSDNIQVLDPTRTEQLFVNMINLLTDPHIYNNVGKMTNEELFDKYISKQLISTGDTVKKDEIEPEVEQLRLKKESDLNDATKSLELKIKEIVNKFKFSKINESKTNKIVKPKVDLVALRKKKAEEKAKELERIRKEKELQKSILLAKKAEEKEKRDIEIETKRFRNKIFSDLNLTNWKFPVLSILEELGINEDNPLTKELFDCIKIYKNKKYEYDKIVSSITFKNFVNFSSDKNGKRKFFVKQKLDSEEELSENSLLEEGSGGLEEINFTNILLKLKEQIEKNKELKGKMAVSSGQGSFPTSEYWKEITGKTADVPKSDILIGDDGISVKFTSYQLLSGSPYEAKATVIAALDGLGKAKNAILKAAQVSFKELEDDFETLKVNATMQSANVQIPENIVDHLRRIKDKLNRNFNFIDNGKFTEGNFNKLYRNLKNSITYIASDEGISNKPEHAALNSDKETFVKGDIFVADTDNLKYLSSLEDNINQIINIIGSRDTITLTDNSSTDNIVTANISKKGNLLILVFSRKTKDGKEIESGDVVIDTDLIKQFVSTVESKELKTVQGKDNELKSNKDIFDLFKKLEVCTDRMNYSLTELCKSKEFKIEFTKEAASGLKKFGGSDESNPAVANRILVWDKSFQTNIKKLDKETIEKISGELKTSFRSKSTSDKKTTERITKKIGYNLNTVLRGTINGIKLSESINKKYTIRDFINENSIPNLDHETSDGEMEFNPKSINNLFGTFDNKIVEIIKEHIVHEDDLTESVSDFISKNVNSLKDKFLKLVNWVVSKFYEFYEYIKKSIFYVFEIFDIEIDSVNYSVNLGALFDET